MYCKLTMERIFLKLFVKFMVVFPENSIIIIIKQEITGWSR